MTDLAADTSDLRVLIVDDNVAIRETTELLLRLQHYSTMSAGDGMQALECAARFQPDLILLDIALPRMDGYEVARELQKIEFATAPLLIAVTAFTHSEARLRCAEAGFDYHLHKPVDFEVFDRLVLLLQENCRLRRQLQWQLAMSAQASRSVIRLAMQTAATLLDVASTTTNGETKQRCLAKAHKALDDATRWMQRRPGDDKQLRPELIQLASRLVRMFS